MLKDLRYAIRTLLKRLGFLVVALSTLSVRAARVSPEFFPLFRTKPLSGRTIQASDVQAKSEPVTVISYRLWQRRFGGAADVVNRKITLSGLNGHYLNVIRRLNLPRQSRKPKQSWTRSTSDWRRLIQTRIRAGVFV